MAADYQERPYQPWPVLSREPAGFWEPWPFEPWPVDRKGDEPPSVPRLFSG